MAAPDADVADPVDFRHFARFLQRVHLRQEKPDAEGAALAGGTLDGHLAAHQGGQHARDRQPDAAAARLGGTAAHERLENAIEVVRRNAGAGVANLENGHVMAEFDREINLSGHREFHRVTQHVDENLAQSSLIGANDAGHLAGRLVMETQSLVAGLQLEHADDLLQEIREIERLRFERHFPALDARDVEGAFDDGQQVVAAPADDVDRLPPIGRDRFVVVENLGVAENAVERGAQLVADRRDVAAFLPDWPDRRSAWLSAAARRCAGANRFPASAGASGDSIPPGRPAGSCASGPSTRRRSRQRAAGQRRS